MTIGELREKIKDLPEGWTVCVLDQRDHSFGEVASITAYLHGTSGNPRIYDAVLLES